jgi:hypothetical protein
MAAGLSQTSPPQEGEVGFAGRMLSLHISHQFRVWSCDLRYSGRLLSCVAQERVAGKIVCFYTCSVREPSIRI